MQGSVVGQGEWVFERIWILFVAAALPLDEAVGDKLSFFVKVGWLQVTNG